MRDLAFNWDGVAYDTGKPIRIQEQVIRIVPNTTTLKAQYNLASCMLHPPIYSREDLRVQDAQEEELAVVIGELLPEDFEYNYPENLFPTQSFDFGRHDLIIPTQDRVGYVIETFSGNRSRQCFLLCNERFDGVRFVKRIGGLHTNAIRDRLFYYHEFSKCEARTKLDRWSFFLRKIKDFIKAALEKDGSKASGPGHT
ncbi:unnamed protein product [Fusarium equiseti]|uniref:Uncharacterized protein n=1 Tax=Fusarium equiseti TaxID=61235 RepID=A0A8J2NEL2_FUSEQ|nr:unnamed protein product [Fusarium equiseti]